MIKGLADHLSELRGKIYSALEKGVVDGATWPAVEPSITNGMVAKVHIRPTYGEYQSALVNLNNWNRLLRTCRIY
jgi:TRAP-type mannitol/chloroaromatic compound transport system substrate-binding protein